ncbi:MAG: TipAS antibiotic-recognition domain-containing protein, partial [Christensenellaceae bacterium]|nr:TipAS antibiotic-recognition domain-containing protein [Christensenellaceae bacterium]
HMGLAAMYVADGRFSAYYEQAAPGGAAFLQKAIACYYGKNG